MRIIKYEQIHLLARTHGYLPAAFRWRGRRFDVVAVEKCWTVQRPAVHRLFRVRCTAGSFVLEQCLASDTWQVTRWPLALLMPWTRPSRAVRFPLPRSQRRPRRLASAAQPARLEVKAASAQTARRQPWTAASQPP